MNLAVSSISGSSLCTKYLREQIYSTSKSDSPKDTEIQNISQILGIGIHEMIQFFLELPSGARRKNLEQCQIDLEILRKNHEDVSDLLIRAFPKNYFSTGLIYPKISKTWEEANPLLQGCINFLEVLEEKFPDSDGQWRILSEIPIHKESKCGSYDHTPGVTRHILQQEITLRGYIDLIFEWKNIRILGELKTGKKTKQKESNWKNQVKIYMDVWTELHPEHTVYGVILQKNLKKGFKNLTKCFDFSPLAELNNTVGGPQCRNCKFRETCQQSTSLGAPITNL
tara:strand:- start:125 stop:973 length:849 start_codon:yes stop_codon:yes gene_type:complete